MHRDPAVHQRNADAMLDLLQASAEAATQAERQFVLLNQSRAVWPYQIAMLWQGDSLVSHSGAGSIEQQGPYAQWLKALFKQVHQKPNGPLSAEDVGDHDVAMAWQEWWPEHALFMQVGDKPEASAMMLVRDIPWLQHEVQELGRWLSLWHTQNRDKCAAEAANRAINWAMLGASWRAAAGSRQRKIWQAAALIIGVALLPVHLTVRAPGELVPRDPIVLRAAVDGMVRALKVQPNQAVKAGQVLAELDDAAWSNRLQVAQQALLTAETEWRQVSQQALNDPKAKASLASAQGKYEERKADVSYLSQQVQRTAIVAPRDGVVLIQDAGSWPGRTVAMGEAVMKLAQPQDQEVEAWLAAGDAIDLKTGATMRLHLSSHPASPIDATLRTYAYEAEHRPDLGWGYRLRGSLAPGQQERLGARGTVRIDGPWVPLSYWVLRRPLAALRETTGW